MQLIKGQVPPVSLQTPVPAMRIGCSGFGSILRIFDGPRSGVETLDETSWSAGLARIRKRSTNAATAADGSFDDMGPFRLGLLGRQGAAATGAEKGGKAEFGGVGGKMFDDVDPEPLTILVLSRRIGIGPEPRSRTLTLTQFGKPE